MKKLFAAVMMILTFLYCAAFAYAASFEQSDLEGTWKGSGFLMVNMDGYGRKAIPYFGTFIFDAAGNLTHGQWVSADADSVDTGAYSGGNVVLAEDGSLSGEFVSPNSRYQIKAGQMDPSANVITMVFHCSVTKDKLGQGTLVRVGR